jgi:uncharacterized membrane protein
MDDKLLILYEDIIIFGLTVIGINFLIFITEKKQPKIANGIFIITICLCCLEIGFLVFYALYMMYLFK